MHAYQHPDNYDNINNHANYINTLIDNYQHLDNL